MAAPALIVAIPAILTALWSGLLTLGKWFLEHAHIAKIIVVCTLIIAAFYSGRIMHGFVMNQLASFFETINDTTPGPASMSLGILAKANYCLPISEMLALLSVYVMFAGMCMTVKMMISLWRSTPFKAS